MRGTDTHRVSEGTAAQRRDRRRPLWRPRHARTRRRTGAAEHEGGAAVE